MTPWDVLSVTQPWAWAIVAGWKPVENRTWAPPARLIGQRLHIHASATRDQGAERAVARMILRTGGADPNPVFAAGYIIVEAGNFPTGAILGSVRLVGVVRTALDIRNVGTLGLDPRTVKIWWELGAVGWLFSDPILLPTPIPAKGRLGAWKFNEGER